MIKTRSFYGDEHKFCDDESKVKVLVGLTATEIERRDRIINQEMIEQERDGPINNSLHHFLKRFFEVNP